VQFGLAGLTVIVKVTVCGVTTPIISSVIVASTTLLEVVNVTVFTEVVVTGVFVSNAYPSVDANAIATTNKTRNIPAKRFIAIELFTGLKS